MKAATLKIIKDELSTLSAETLQQMLLRLARFKAENKELLTYLLFESNNEAAFVEEAIREMDEQFLEIRNTSGYIIRKQLRKIIKHMLKHIRYSGEPETEARLRLHFCMKMHERGLHQNRSTTIRNMYTSQRTYTENTIQKMHEDLQYEFEKELAKLEQ